MRKPWRLKLADDLWLSGMDDKAAVPQWHRETLDERWQNYQDGKAKRLTLKQLEQCLGKR
jgi:hypothetical protein